MLVRGPGLAASMSRYLIDRIEATPNIELQTAHRADRAARRRGRAVSTASPGATGATGSEERCDVRNVFLFVGAEPETDWLEGCGVARRRARLRAHRRGAGATRRRRQRRRRARDRACPACSPSATCARARSSASAARSAKARRRWRRSTSACPPIAVRHGEAIGSCRLDESGENRGRVRLHRFGLGRQRFANESLGAVAAWRDRARARRA